MEPSSGCSVSEQMMTPIGQAGPTSSTTARRSRTHLARSLMAQSDATDNSHADTKGHELHVAPDPEPEIIEFPGMVALWERFWSEIPKPEFEGD